MIKDPSALPQELMNFLSFLEQEIGVPVTYLSTGPGREEILKMK
ncbi:adenylosuccinate synthetase [Chryseobacterium tructae]|nr:adenylosuccinate synthetase [Chryseobacterium tructae]MDN3691137.1 adenylosuccinate synthetase [Chryseobacterium tructae]